jgi:hypothetical protein
MTILEAKIPNNFVSLSRAQALRPYLRAAADLGQQAV